MAQESRHPDQPEPSYTFPTYIREEVNDFPQPGLQLGNIGPLAFPQLVFGAATLSTIYNTEGLLQSDIPVRTVRLALRYGIRAFDTSPYYGDSEVVLGQCLQALAGEFPRSSYKIITKCGRYGSDEFDYTPSTIRKSVLRSLKRLGTSYLDVLLLHDVDFVASPMCPFPLEGLHSKVFTDAGADWGLVPGKEGKVWGSGDRRVIEALTEMRKLKEEGLVRAIGISGYTLPMLLRVAILALHTPPFQPLDTVLSYSHYTLQNSAFVSFLPHLHSDAKLSQVFCASPLSMGLLTARAPPWHPAPTKLKEVAAVAYERVKEWPGELPNLAVGYTLKREGEIMGCTVGLTVPTVIGLSNLHEVHEAVALWREVNNPTTDGVPRRYAEGLVKSIFQEQGYLDWSWSCPPSFRKTTSLPLSPVQKST
ncbi:Aldo/keto reductase [Dacryopinax primogenitus]|uniref:Aldo/keto reductase n=1 Tax=Dacryopinax primogenitus (strain DJM 731) TaxID=1858805 RepID=M5GFN2_DACPD|nr:Aldo/keto reductase [Dacryopinax primogenitus]EJU06462.1 Aldo/keto reductase [Dacryopinax primogenitus]